MKLIILNLFLFAVNAAMFAYTAVTHNSFSLLSWVVCLALVLSTMAHAASYEKKMYRYMISFFHKDGSGRMFFSADSKKIDENLIRKSERAVSRESGLESVLAISVQRMG